jgi:hypothetical protein
MADAAGGRRKDDDGGGDDDDDDGGGFHDADVVSAHSFAEVTKYVKQGRHFIRVEKRVEAEVLSKVRTQGLMRKVATLTLLVAVGALIAGRFFPDRTSPRLRQPTTRAGLAAGAVGGLCTQLVVNSSPFFNYEILYDKNQVLHLSRKGD